MTKDEKIKAGLREKCRLNVDKIIEQSHRIKELLNSPEKHQYIGWEYIGTLDKLQQELNSFAALLQNVVKPIN